jgi:hypothetical protein
MVTIRGESWKRNVTPYDSGTFDALFKTEAQDRIRICYEEQWKNLMKERCAKNVKEEIEEPGLL